MSASSFRGSRPDSRVSPRPPMDAHQRYLIHGPIRPMTKPGLLDRLFGRH